MMTSFYKSFLFFIAALIVLITVLSKTTAFIDYVTWFILAYFILITAGFHYGLVKSAKGNPQQYIRYYMGGTSFKLLIHAVILVIYCLFHRSDAVRFIITFAAFYLCFTVFEFTAVKKSFKK